MPTTFCRPLLETAKIRLSTCKKEEKEAKDENSHRLERSFGSFSRMMDPPSDVDQEEIDATYKKGVLKLVFKKTRETEAKKIEIKTG